MIKSNFVASVTIVVDGALRDSTWPFGLWIVVSQDCDLFDADDHDTEPTIELRPLFSVGPPPVFGIRSRKLRVSHSRPHYLESASPRLMVSPAALTLTVRDDIGRREVWLDEDELTALKTWLGLRYDRPAVPEHLVSLARNIAKQVESRKSDATVDEVRDILAQFDDSKSPPAFRLFAIVTEGADLSQVRKLLLEAALGVDAELGVAAGVEVGTSAQISINVLEESVAVDLSQITWRTGRPKGAP